MKKKILALCLVVVLAATAVIGGTLAYFTDTDEVKNTFTIGKVGLDVIEYKDGVPSDTGFDYTNMMPGVPYSKDANVIIDSDSQDAWTFVELEFTNAHQLWAVMGSLKLDTGDMVNILLDQPNTGILNNANICAFKMDEANGGTYSVVYKCGVKKAGEVINLFKGIKLPKEFSNTEAGILTAQSSLAVKAHAIQAEGIDETTAINELLLKAGYTDIANHPNL